MVVRMISQLHNKYSYRPCSKIEIWLIFCLNYDNNVVAELEFEFVPVQHFHPKTDFVVWSESTARIHAIIVIT